jgi:hypothetical protein
MLSSVVIEATDAGIFGSETLPWRMSGFMSLSGPEVGRAPLLFLIGAKFEKINTPHDATVIVNEAMNVVEQPVHPFKCFGLVDIPVPGTRSWQVCCCDTSHQE